MDTQEKDTDEPPKGVWGRIKESRTLFFIGLVIFILGILGIFLGIYLIRHRSSMKNLKEVYPVYVFNENSGFEERYRP